MFVKLMVDGGSVHQQKKQIASSLCVFNPRFCSFEDPAFHHPWDNLEVNAFSPFSLICWLLNWLKLDISGPSLATSGVLSRFTVHTGG